DLVLLDYGVLNGSRETEGRTAVQNDAVGLRVLTDNLIAPYVSSTADGQIEPDPVAVVDGSARVPAGARRHVVVLDICRPGDEVQEYPRSRGAPDLIASHPHLTREGNQRHTVSQRGLNVFDGVVFDQDGSGDPYRISRRTDPQALPFSGTRRESQVRDNPRES